MKHLPKLATMASAVGLGAMLLTATASFAAQPTVQLKDLGLQEVQENAGLGDQTFQATAGQLIRVVLSTLGLIAIAITIWGGFRWMTAGGSEDKVDEAKKILYSGIIGIVIILSAYAMTNFVLGALIGATTVGTP